MKYLYNSSNENDKCKCGLHERKAKQDKTLTGIIFSMQNFTAALG